jgi:DNA replication and repair protein RecF
VDNVISAQSAVDWDPNSVYDAHRSRLRELARAEIDSGQSLIGPHKHDVRFLFQNKDARFFCSQGQQRAIILAFKIAQILLFQQKRGESPFLLLDDVLSELDQVRRHNLLKVLSSLKSQIFMTSTELGVPEEFAKSELAVFEVQSGRVKEQG